MRAFSFLRLGLAVAVACVAVLAAATSLSAATSRPADSTIAPNFVLPDIYGSNFSLDANLNQSVVVVEFTSISCSECQIVEQSLQTIYHQYNATGTSPVRIVSIFIEPGFGDTIPALRAYHASHNVTWTMAQDTSSLAVSKSYGVLDIPDVFIIDHHQHATYNVVGVQSTQQLQSSLQSALAGTGRAISFVTVSVFALAAVAGVSTFFSPCAFPMFPGYMSLFLGLSADRAQATAKGSYGGAARRAFTAGSAAALGMLLVFLALGIALIFVASSISKYIPYLQVIVGGVLVVFGALLLTNLQYWKIVAPFQRLWERIRSSSGEPTPVVPAAGSTEAGKGFYLKLFSYGLGYAAAAAGCVAPVILAAVVAGMALGLVSGLINIAIYSLTAAVLMIGVTVLLAVAGKKWVNGLKAATPVIKKVSAVALLIVGVYLIYFFYTAWGITL